VSSLLNKKIVLGVTGSIAAYKAAFLTRLLVKQGAEVTIVMTASAFDFITPLTLATLSKNPVYSDFVTDKTTGTWANHVQLANQADYILIAPATANTLAKMANGRCDDLLQAVYLSAACPVMVAPAMDLEMYKHHSTQENLAKLKLFGVWVIPPGEGELASGLVGEGRMAEPEEIVAFVENHFQKKSSLIGKRALVTAGSTHEAIDPVRFIGNHSSGKMGFAIAEELAERGAQVTLICGPNALAASSTLQRIDVVTADEMYEQCMKHSKQADIIVMAAAVADFKPAFKQDKKIKKESGVQSIELMPTKDILAELGKNKKGSFLVGFALETNDAIHHAKKKLYTKNLDFIVLNSPTAVTGFKHDTNKITIIDSESLRELELMSKKDAAKEIVNTIVNKLS
jgi:phosphopantothenoylcysteine decarboxylase / phosphopantothenate---cysteine ligase